MYVYISVLVSFGTIFLVPNSLKLSVIIGCIMSTWLSLVLASCLLRLTTPFDEWQIILYQDSTLSLKNTYCLIGNLTSELITKQMSSWKNQLKHWGISQFEVKDLVIGNLIVPGPFHLMTSFKMFSNISRNHAVPQVTSAVSSKQLEEYWFLLCTAHMLRNQLFSYRYNLIFNMLSTVSLVPWWIGFSVDLIFKPVWPDNHIDIWIAQYETAVPPVCWQWQGSSWVWAQPMRKDFSHWLSPYPEWSLTGDTVVLG